MLLLCSESSHGFASHSAQSPSPYNVYKALYDLVPASFLTLPATTLSPAHSVQANLASVLATHPAWTVLPPQSARFTPHLLYVFTQMSSLLSILSNSTVRPFPLPLLYSSYYSSPTLYILLILFIASLPAITCFIKADIFACFLSPLFYISSAQNSP